MIFLYLKLRPVHMHAGAVGVAEPLQVFLRAGWCDGAFEFSVYCSVTARRQRGFSDWPMAVSHRVNLFKRVKPFVFCEVEVAFDVQQHLPEEAQPLLFKLLALIEHLLHAFHVLRRALTQLVQGLLILLPGLGGNMHTRNKLSYVRLYTTFHTSCPHVPVFRLCGWTWSRLTWKGQQMCLQAQEKILVQECEVQGCQSPVQPRTANVGEVREKHGGGGAVRCHTLTAPPWLLKIACELICFWAWLWKTAFACRRCRGPVRAAAAEALTFWESCLHLSTFSCSFFCWSAVTEASPLLLASLMDASFSSLQAMWKDFLAASS